MRFSNNRHLLTVRCSERNSLPMRLPNTQRLICFLEVAKGGSLARAAERVCLTHGAVSRHLSSLESQLGVALFQRDRQRLVLTEAGRLYADEVQTALDALRMAQLRLNAFRPTATLTVSCEPSLAQCWLIPGLAELKDAEFKPTSLCIASEGGPVDVRGSAIDLAIRREDFSPDPAARRTPLMQEHMGLVCAPDLVARASGDRDLPRLLTTSRPGAWDDWAARTAVRWQAESQLVFNHFHLAIEAARAGLGVAVVPYPHVQADLRASLLAAPFGFVPTETFYVALTDPSQKNAQRIERLLQCLVAWAVVSVPA